MTFQEHHRLLVRQVFQDVVNELTAKAKNNIFHNDSVFNRPYINKGSSRAFELLSFFKETFPKAFENFDEDTNNLFKQYLEDCAAVFDAIADKRDKYSLYVLSRFLTIALVFGIDRALLSLNKKDQLMIYFTMKPGDRFCVDTFTKNEIHKKAPTLKRAQDFYTAFLRVDDFNPHDPTKRFHNQNPNEYGLLEFQSVHDFLRNQNAERVEPEKSKNSDIKTQGKTVLPSSQSPPSPSKPILKNVSPQNITTSSKQTMTSKSTGIPESPADRKKIRANDSLNLANPCYRRDQQTQNSSDEFNPDANSSQQRQISFNKINSIRICTSEDEPQSSSSDSDEHNPKPVEPIFYSKAENPYYGEPLARDGTVYDSSKAVKVVKKPNEGIMQAAYNTLCNLGYPEEETKLVLGLTTGVAQTISGLIDNKKNRGRSTIKKIPEPAPNRDLRPSSFDYRRNGRSPSEILGRRFSKMNFKSEAERQATMKEIFQLVVNDPNTTVESHKIAMAQLGMIDIPKIQREEIQNQLAASLSRTIASDPDIVPPPVLGDNDLDIYVLKTLQTRLGLEEKFSIENIGRGALKSILNNLSSVITNAGLRETEAYALLRRITTGLTHIMVENAEFEHRIPFNEFWINLQRTQTRASSTRDFEKKLKAILQNNTVDNIEQTLNEIVIYNEKIHSKETDPNVRRFLCQRDTLQDLRFYIRKHFSSYISQINTIFMDRLRQAAITKNIPNFVNENEYHAGKVYIFLETACEILSQCEPDNQFHRYQGSHSQRNNIYIHAIGAAEPPRSNSPIFKKPQDNRGPPSRNNYSRDNNQQSYSRGSFNNQSRRNPNNTRPQNKPRCFLCNIPGHRFNDCLKYPNQRPGREFCNKCGGQHTTPCQMRQPRNQATYNERNNTRRQVSHVASIQATVATPAPAPTPARPPSTTSNQRQNNQRNYQQQYSQNRGFQPYQNNSQQRYPNSNYQGYRQYQNQGGYRQQYQNNQQGYNNPRYQNQNYGRPPYNGPPRFNYNNQQQRSYQDQGYRNNYRENRYNQQGQQQHYNNNRNYNPNYQNQGYNNYRQGRNYNTNNNSNNQPFYRTPQQSRENPQYRDQLNDVSALIPKPQRQDKPPQQGLGNEGFQPIHPSVQVDAIRNSPINYDQVSPPRH